MKKIDCLGDMCPIPILKIRKEIKSLDSGDTIMVVTDHSCVLESVTSNFKKYKITHEEVINGVWEISISKS